MKCFSKFTRGSSVASYLHGKQTSRIQSLYLYFNYFIKNVPFWPRNVRFLIQNTRSLFYGPHYSSVHHLMSLQRKLNVKIFLMFIVAENTGSVNIGTYLTPTKVKRDIQTDNGQSDLYVVLCFPCATKMSSIQHVEYYMCISVYAISAFGSTVHL